MHKYTKIGVLLISTGFVAHGYDQLMGEAAVTVSAFAGVFYIIAGKTGIHQKEKSIYAYTSC